MEFIKEHLMIRNHRVLIPFPVIFLFIQKSAADLMGICIHIRAESFSAVNAVCPGICIHFSVQKKIILIVLCF